MTTYAIGGQSSGDFRETSARVQLLHVVTRNSVGVLTPDAFTQLNPPNVTTEVSTTLATITKVGVLGGTYAFTRPDYGNGFHGGPTKPGGVYSSGQRPLGIFLNDAIGNAYENTPGVASGRGPYVSGVGGCARQLPLRDLGAARRSRNSHHVRGGQLALRVGERSRHEPFNGRLREPVARRTRRNGGRSRQGRPRRQQLAPRLRHAA